MVSKKWPVVSAGSVVGIEEEFASGPNTFVDDEGNIVSQVAGVLVQNDTTRVLEVVTRRNLLPMGIDAQVVGQVVMVTDHAAVLDVWEATNGSRAVAVPNVTCAVPVSKCDSSFVKSVHDKFHEGDIVIGRVASVSPWGIDLSTQRPDMGVLNAFCSSCRQALRLVGNDLKCDACGTVESRKISSDYWSR
ncbi:MAG: exosome complex RNA-binding protein Csl4 [Candidatus Diapherotrites archaeon]|nr:exosome complex RNA-binding protein Csl4 [Candidatus Diapherotrites archaeon]